MNRRQLRRPVRASRKIRRRRLLRRRRGDRVRSGKAIYRAFHGYEATGVRKLRHKRLRSPVVVKLGDLVGVIYRSDKWRPGRPRNYIHFMEQRPMLVSNVHGTQLYIAGGSYRVTRRGIEG